MLASSLDAAATDILSLFLSSYILSFPQHSSGISPSTLWHLRLLKKLTDYSNDRT